MKAPATLVVLLLLACPVTAAEPPMICFGNEPSWGLQLTDPRSARLLLPDAPPVEYQGSETRLDFIHERAWRGKPASGAGGDLVAFLSDTVCSDGMSDRKHPATARVSLADGRFLAGCCRISASASAPEAATSIEGPIWRLTYLRGLDPLALRDATRPVTAGFKAGRIGGFSGCNQFFGPYTLDRDRVVAIGRLAGSMMACDERSMAVESAVHAALAGTFRYVLAGQRLTLLSGTEPVLTFEAEPAQVLEGVTWKISGFNNGRQAVVSPLSGTVLAVTFKDGFAEGSAGCNTFRATYTADADRIVIGPAAATRMTCAGNGVMQQEREFLSALESATTWGVMGKVLDMHRANGERALTAAAD